MSVALLLQISVMTYDSGFSLQQQLNVGKRHNALRHRLLLQFPNDCLIHNC